MPRIIRKFFKSQSWNPSEETSILVGLPGVVGIVPWLPATAYLELSEKIQREIGKLEASRHNREDPLFADLKLSTSRTLTETLSDAKSTVEQFRGKQWRIQSKNGREMSFSDIASRTASSISNYMGIIAPIAQATPFGAPIVWGAFNVLLKMAMDDADMAYKLSEFIDSYMDASEIFTTYWVLYRHSQARSGQKVRDILGLLEDDIRKFTEGARKYYFSRNAAARILKSAAAPFSAEFQPICDGIRDRTSSLRLAVEAARQDEKKRSDVLIWLSNWPYEDPHRNAVKKRAPDTCNWLRKKDPYLRWATSTFPVLWVHGKAGFGKTILMSSVIDSLREILPRGELRQKHVAYFYCNHDKPDTLDPAVILASILKQIVGTLPEIPEKIIGKYEQQKYLGQPSSHHSLWDIHEFLLDCLRFVPIGSPVFIIIDGVDECQPGARAELLDILTSLTMDKSRSGAVKLAIFSRQYDDIREGLGECLEIPIQKNDNMTDMYTFMSSRISSSKALQTALQSQQALGIKMIDGLVTSAGGSFLWIHIQQETLRRERDPLSITRYLENLPNSSDMEDSYRRIIMQIANDSPGNRNLAETVLGWVLCAVRPLSVAELTDALGFLNLSGRGKEDLKRDIIHSCHGLIDTEKNGDVENFRFVHFSACQFLQGMVGNLERRGSIGFAFDKRGSLAGFNSYIPSPPISPLMSAPSSPMLGNPLSPVASMTLSIDTSQVQRQMAHTCMEYISQRGLKRALLPADEAYKCRQEFDALVDEQPFVLYASHAWFQHYQALRVEDDFDLKSGLLQLLGHQQNLELAFQLFWFQKFVERFPRGSTPLHIATYFGLSDMIATLLMRDDQLDEYFQPDNYGRTPVFWAAFHGNSDALLRFGISTTHRNTSEDPKIQNFMGEALLAAIEGDQKQLVMDLLACGANPNSYIRDGKSTLFYATMKGDANLPMVKRLIQAGATLEPPPPNVSPLEAAALTGSLELATYYLRECRADVNVKTHEPAGLPLRTAVFSGHYDMVRLLLQSGADITLTGEGELLDMASMMGDQEMIGIILQHAPSHTSLDIECPLPTFTQLLPTAAHEKNSQNSKHIQLQSKALKLGIRQGLRMAKVGNMDHGTLTSFVSRAQRILENKFKEQDIAFLEAAEIEMPGLVKEFIEVGVSSLIIENGCHCFAGALIHMERNSDNPIREQFKERAIRVVASLIVHLIDGGCEGHFRTVRSNIETNLTNAIDKRNSNLIDSVFAEVEMGLQLGAVMVRHSLWLRGCAKTFLAGIMAMSSDEGIARFEKYLEGVSAIGLSTQLVGHSAAWRRMVGFIEIGYCAYAYGYKFLYPKIQVKIAALRIIDKAKIQAHEALLGHLAAVSNGGRGDWEWDADETPWWQKI